uniref:Putative chymotrypsin 10 n=1 Tax=Ostrinia nubilalis TaxID=29057 RepID=I6TEX2_OSTNU|nr:putative chymotrypsin 10 [Ostrinia nubilalis]
MKWNWLVFLAAVAVEAGPFKGSQWSYHESVGIPRSEQLKKLELAANSTRIVGGTPVPLGRHPFMVGLVIHLNYVDWYTSMCGASLLTHTRSLTAAHCWDDARMFTLVFGSQTLHTGGLRIDSDDVEVHPDWNPDNLHNDVAIIRHDWVQFNNVISPIILPTEDANNDFLGMWAVAMGYGRISDTNPNPANPELREANLQVISNEECVQRYPNNVVSSTLCTLAPVGINTCVGDSGGPLVAGSGPDRVQIGIVSFVVWGCEDGFPHGFARITSFLPWILSRQ